MTNWIDTRDLAAEAEGIRDELNGPAAALVTNEEKIRLERIENLADEIGDEFHYGALMIPEEEFEAYARSFAEDIGAIDDDARWPATCIDWAEAADELRADFTSLTFDGDDYLVRP